MELQSVDDLVANNTFKELSKVYEDLFGIKSYHKRKVDIAHAIWQYQQDTIRTEDLIKNLR